MTNPQNPELLNLIEPTNLLLNQVAYEIDPDETDHLLGIRFPNRIPTDHPERLH